MRLAFSSPGLGTSFKFKCTASTPIFLGEFSSPGLGTSFKSALDLQGVENVQRSFSSPGLGTSFKWDYGLPVGRKEVFVFVPWSGDFF